MSTVTKVFVIVFALIVFFGLTVFPGWLPLRALEGVLHFGCEEVFHGEFTVFSRTDFEGMGGTMVRRDFVECGRDKALDAGRVCFSTEAEVLIDDCEECAFGAEDLNDKGTLRACRPYRSFWRWRYWF